MLKRSLLISVLALLLSFPINAAPDNLLFHKICVAYKCGIKDKRRLHDITFAYFKRYLKKINSLDEGKFAEFLEALFLDIDFIETCDVYDTLTERDWRKISTIRQGLRSGLLPHKLAIKNAKIIIDVISNRLHRE